MHKPDLVRRLHLEIGPLMHLAAQIDEHDLATPLAKLDPDRKGAFRPQREFRRRGAAAEPVAAVRGDELLLRPAAAEYW